MNKDILISCKRRYSNQKLINKQKFDVKLKTILTGCRENELNADIELLRVDWGEKSPFQDLDTKKSINDTSKSD